MVVKFQGWVSPLRELCHAHQEQQHVCPESQLVWRPGRELSLCAVPPPLPQRNTSRSVAAPGSTHPAAVGAWGGWQDPREEEPQQPGPAGTAGGDPSKKSLCMLPAVLAQDTWPQAQALAAGGKGSRPFELLDRHPGEAGSVGAWTALPASGHPAGWGQQPGWDPDGDI